MPYSILKNLNAADLTVVVVLSLYTGLKIVFIALEFNSVVTLLLALPCTGLAAVVYAKFELPEAAFANSHPIIVLFRTK